MRNATHAAIAYEIKHACCGRVSRTLPRSTQAECAKIAKPCEATRDDGAGDERLARIEFRLSLPIDFSDVTFAHPAAVRATRPRLIHSLDEIPAAERGCATPHILADEVNLFIAPRAALASVN